MNGYNVILHHLVHAQPPLPVIMSYDGEKVCDYQGNIQKQRRKESYQTILCCLGDNQVDVHIPSFIQKGSRYNQSQCTRRYLRAPCTTTELWCRCFLLFLKCGKQRVM